MEMGSWFYTARWVCDVMVWMFLSVQCGDARWAVCSAASLRLLQRCLCVCRESDGSGSSEERFASFYIWFGFCYAVLFVLVRMHVCDKPSASGRHRGSESAQPMAVSDIVAAGTSATVGTRNDAVEAYCTRSVQVVLYLATRSRQAK